MLFDSDTLPSVWSNPPGVDLLEYIRSTGPNSDLAQRIIGEVIEDRWAAHHHRVNEHHHPNPFKPNDIVMVCIESKSDAKKGHVAKLTYKNQGPYRILKDTGHGSFLVTLLQHAPHGIDGLDFSTIPTAKYLPNQLCMVPPGLLPCLPVDTPDQCFNSIDFGPLQHPLKCSLNIEEYNSIWFDTNSVPPSYHTRCSTTHQPKPMIEETKQTQFPSIQSLSDSLDPPASVTSPPPTSSSSPKPNQPPQQIQASSKDNLFFICYVWEGTA
jgi:hypothetical protein